MTPPLEKGIILPGVTRRSILELAESWGEFEVNERTICMDELVQATQDGSLVEVFGSGTAAVVTPVGAIHYQGRLIKLPTPTAGLAHRYGWGRRKIFAYLSIDHSFILIPTLTECWTP